MEKLPSTTNIESGKEKLVKKKSIGILPKFSSMFFLLIIVGAFSGMFYFFDEYSKYMKSKMEEIDGGISSMNRRIADKISAVDKSVMVINDQMQENMRIIASSNDDGEKINYIANMKVMAEMNLKYKLVGSIIYKVTHGKVFSEELKNLERIHDLYLNNVINSDVRRIASYQRPDDNELKKIVRKSLEKQELIVVESKYLSITKKDDDAILMKKINYYLDTSDWKNVMQTLYELGYEDNNIRELKDLLKDRILGQFLAEELYDFLNMKEEESEK